MTLTRDLVSAATDADDPAAAWVGRLLRRRLAGVVPVERRARALEVLADLTNAVLAARRRVAVVEPPGTGLFWTERRMVYLSRGTRPYLAPHEPERVLPQALYFSRDIVSEELSVASMVEYLIDLGEPCEGLLSADQLEGYARWQVEQALGCTSL